MDLQIDTQENSQVAPSGAAKRQQTRTIYDAGYNEIFWKSLLAGFSLGLGRTFASIIFYAVVLGFVLTYIAPLFEQIMAPVNRLIPILEQSGQQQQSLRQQIDTFFIDRQK